MSSKTLNPANVHANGKNVGGETSYEDPSPGRSSSANESSSGAETEIEDVEGFNIFKPGESDKEVSNGTEAATESTFLEESGTSLTEDEEPILDAFYASYGQLKQEAASQMREVIIGTDNRVRINPTTSYPWRAICALKITAANGTKWIGTGWLISPRTVITAGHCVYMHDEGGWAKSIEVIPARNDTTNPIAQPVALI